MSKVLSSELREVVDKIVIEIKRVRQGKYGVYYSDLVNYINGHGEWDFDDCDEGGLIWGEKLGGLSGEELSRIINWCYQHI